MQNNKWLYALLVLVGVSLSGAALADRGHSRGRVGLEFYLGAPFPHPYYASPFYYYPYPYYPRVVEVPVEPPVYIERGDTPSADQQAPENYYWYHCDKPSGYYPYIQQCPGGWQKIVPMPPPQQ